MIDGALGILERPARREQEGHDAKGDKHEEARHVEQERHREHSAENPENFRDSSGSSGQRNERGHSGETAWSDSRRRERFARPSRRTHSHEGHFPSGVPNNLAVEFHRGGDLGQRCSSSCSRRESCDRDSHLDQLQTVSQRALPFLRFRPLEQIERERSCRPASSAASELTPSFSSFLRSVLSALGT